ncbi:hypothetical protein [Glaciimonas soli]|uniref:hypothetical protein n=1 Tax=Glaciimonas soli TaxID=2590999 RepID=UPI0018852B71|nr:hypothetical protein [Glaciimonas soli]
MSQLFLKRTFIAAVIIVSSLLSGCASIVNGTSQIVSVEASDSGAKVIGASCKLQNDKGVFYVTTPGTVTVHRAYGDLSVSCEKPNVKPGSAVVKSTTKAMAFGNILIGGLVGVAVDTGSGAAYDYPDHIVVLMNGNIASQLSNGQNLADRVPFSSNSCQSSYEFIRSQPKPRAFAISKDGHCGYVSLATARGATDLKEVAIANCKKHTNLDCTLYLVDDSIVYNGQLDDVQHAPALAPQAPIAAMPVTATPTTVAAATAPPPTIQIPAAIIAKLPPEQIGQYSYQAEHLPEAKSCASTPQAILTNKGPGLESYTVSCDNGDAIAMRCDNGQCRVLR